MSEFRTSARGLVGRECFVGSMRRAATGVTVVTTAGPAGRGGLTVSAMCSLSIDPPSLLVCINRASRMHAAVCANRTFCVNVLADTQSAVADRFAGRVPVPQDDRFAGAAWYPLETGSPALVGAVASFDCRLRADLPFGTHDILVGVVSACRATDGAPLVYTDRRYGTVDLSKVFDATAERRPPFRSRYDHAVR